MKSNYESKALRELASLSEAQLQSQIIEPLLRSIGFENVRDNSGPGEKGKDLVATKKSEFGRNKLYGIQIKKTKLSARINSINSLGNLFLQLLQARYEEVVDPTSNISRSPDACVFITPYPIAPSVWEKFHKLSQDLDRQNIEIIDGSKLLDLIESHLPDFLDHFSMEVRYRYQLKRDLNQIPESTLAFRLTTELELDNIYIESSLSDSDDLFELISTKPALLKGRKLLVASPTDIDQLNEFGDWLGVKARITDPPSADSPQEEERIFELSQTIEKKSEKKPIQVDIDPLILKLKERLKDALLEFAQISSCIDENDYTQIATDFITIQDKLRDFRDSDLIFENWIHLVEPVSKPEWVKPQIKLPSSLIERINCNKYILGEPGVGKTTLLRRVAQNLLKSSNDELPIFVPLVLVREPSKEGLVNACVQQLKNQGYQFGKGKNAIRKFISKASSGDFHLFLDGLDEVGPNSDELLGCIEEFSLEHPLLISR
jgi:predicted NACHT family NTPase